MSKQQITGIIIVVALVSGGLGYAIGAGSNGGTFGQQGPGVTNVVPPMPDTNFIAGEVKAVNGNVITLNTPTAGPTDKSPKEREVTVTSDTKIIKQEEKSRETITKEQETYAKKTAAWTIESNKPMPVPPWLYVEKSISVSGIKIGDRIVVEASIPVRLVEKFEAVKITVEYNNVIPPPANLPAAPVSL